ncbi:unnamed protein product [Leptidea sinapis]|uniref:mannosyl-oligosaccharide glucosidase n=1 Tax=Leptidea sinapis TaxID=189913 RepID=A0A5E4R1Q3_9NEOP|nr:unnamed protein product [Leptidea sinapis]
MDGPTRPSRPWRWCGTARWMRPAAQARTRVSGRTAATSWATRPRSPPSVCSWCRIKLKEKVYSLLQAEGRLAVLAPDRTLDGEKQVNFVAVQLVVEPPCVVDVVFRGEGEGEAAPLQGERYSARLRDLGASFDAAFEDKFRLAEKGRSTRGSPCPTGRRRCTPPSFFPRGFLWDEGFHGLLIGRWSIDIQLDIAGHWLDLINFVVQHNAAANPPMLLLTLAQLLRLWYNWFLASQRGSEPSSFRWRGRVDDGRQLNPKTLTSGLDDYPRASHPSERERHVDLRCWLQAAAAALADLAAALRRDPARFTAVRDQLADEETLNRLHWSSRTNSYADYGYVSLFPMLLKVLSPGSDKLGKILEVLDDPDKLWSPYGLSDGHTTRSTTRRTGAARCGSTSTTWRSRPCATTAPRAGHTPRGRSRCGSGSSRTQRGVAVPAQRVRVGAVLGPRRHRLGLSALHRLVGAVRAHDGRPLLNHRLYQGTTQTVVDVGW